MAQNLSGDPKASIPNQASQQMTISEIETIQGQLLSRQRECLRRHQQISQTIEMIERPMCGIAMPYSLWVAAAAAPTLNVQRAELQAVEEEMARIMQETREMADRGRRLTEYIYVQIELIRNS